MLDYDMRVMQTRPVRQGIAYMILAVAAVTVTARPARAQNGFQVIDVPGAVYTDAHGINNAGDVVGEYTDADWNQHGFLLSGGVYTTIDVPGAVTTIAFDINNDGKIVGTYGTAPTETAGRQHGFVLAAGTFTTIDAGLQDTWALGINDAGDIAGWFDDVYDGAFYAFTRLHSGGVTTITFPGEDGSEAGDINNDGTVVGAAGGEGFRWTAGVFAGLPNGCPVSYQPRINNVGRILVGNGTCTEDGFVPFKVPVPSPYWDSTPSWHRSSRWHSNLR